MILWTKDIQNKGQKKDPGRKAMQSEKTGAEGTALKKWEITGYGLGGFASTLPNQFKTQFGMSFMTDVAGVPIGIVGILSMAMSVWDAVNDPVIGHIADNTRT